MVRIGIFGVTGMVGREVLRVLSDRNYPLTDLKVYASERSVGKEIEFLGTDSLKAGKFIVENADTADYNDLDVAFYAIGGGWPSENAPKAIASGCYVIDNSSTFRYDDDVPLVIPEINPNAIGNSKLIANPNCTTAIAAIPLYYIYKNYGLKKVIISTYQATSGAGAEGMAELEAETRRVLEGEKANNSVFAHPIPFNVIPHIDKFQDNKYTKEEMKVVWETNKIFGTSENNKNLKIPVSCTCVRIPTIRAHSESIVVETEKQIDAEKLREELKSVKGIIVKDDINNNVYPMPINASAKYDVEVGRIRQNLIFNEHGVEFFVCGDQILKGAALNAVQIAEVLIEKI
jgi:aspartate-semialdehyde dehydrogenase